MKLLSSDGFGNSININDSLVILSLSTGNVLKIGTLDIESKIFHRTIFKPNQYFTDYKTGEVFLGFCNDFMQNLATEGYLVTIYDEMSNEHYSISALDIMSKAHTFLWFKKQGFEKQVFINMVHLRK